MYTWAGLRYGNEERTFAVLCTNEGGSTCALETSRWRPPPLDIKVSPDAFQAADRLNKTRATGSWLGYDSCCWWLEVDARPALLSPLQLWSTPPPTGSDLRSAIHCPVQHLQTVRFVLSSSVCLRLCRGAAARAMNIVNKN